MEDQTPGGKYGLGRVAFIAHLTDIQKEVEAGYPMTTIYEKRKEKLGITYSQFARHIQRYIHKQAPTKRAVSPTETVPTEAVASAKGKTADTPFHEKFEFNPIAPDYDDLI